MRIRSLTVAAAIGLLLTVPASATTSIIAKAQGSTGWFQDLGQDSATNNVRPLVYLLDPTSGNPITPFQAGGNIGNTAFIANAGTNLNTSLLALESGGNLASLVTQLGAVTAFPLSNTVMDRLKSINTAQTAGTQKTQIVDGSGNVVATTSNNLDVQCANCSGSGVSAIDEATFTGGTSLFAAIGGFFQTTPTSNALTSGQQGMAQLTTNRALFINPRNAAGTEIGTAGAPFRIDPIGTTTQPVAETDTAGTLAALGALNATAQATMAGENGAGVLIAAGTLVGTVTPEISYDPAGGNWKATQFYDSATGLTSANIVFASANPNTQLTIVVPGGVKFVRVKVSSYTSGTGNATVIATNANTPLVAAPSTGLPVNVLGAIQGGTIGSAIPGAGNHVMAGVRDSSGNVANLALVGGNGTGLLTSPAAAATGGATPSSAVVPNNTTGVNLKPSAGTAYGAQLGGISAAPAYLKLYDKATIPTCGTDTPIKRLIIPAASTAALGAGSNVSFGVAGIKFTLGIGYCVTTGIADADTTAPAASTFLVNIDWN